MTRYCAFFAALNVGGNTLRMADLRAALEREEFASVETVVASGNVLFDHEERPTDGLEDLLAWILKDRFDIDTFAAVRDAEEIAAALAENPFVGEGEDKHVHVLFLNGQPGPAQFDKLLADHQGRGNEKIAPGTRCLHLDYVDGVGRSRLTGDFIARRLGFKGTARNVASLRRIVEKMG